MADLIFPGEIPVDVLGTTRLPTNVNMEWWKGDYQEYILVMEDENNNPTDLTGLTPEAFIRASFDSPTLYEFECTVQNGNEVRIYLSSAVSATIPAGDYIWNFQMTNAEGDVRTYLAGDVLIHDEVDAA